MTFKVGKNEIGEGHPCFIIAEAGSNHDGDLEQAKRLIQVAAEAGAQAVKFQVFRASRLYTRSAGMSDYLQLKKSIYDVIAEMETPYEWLPVLAETCRRFDILFLASAFDEESIDRIDPFVDAHKIASYEMTHLPMVQYIARKKKPIFISTGTATLAEVEETVRTLKECGTSGFALLQCTAAYPAPLDSLNLRAIPNMKKAFGVPVGLSDHSRDPILAPIAAVACGADVLEKHFTLGNHLPGPDHPFAIEPPELSELVHRVREAESSLGTGEKTVQLVEQELRKFARRSIFSIRNIDKGEVLGQDNIAVLRCGKLPGHMEPKHYPALLGKKARRKIPAETAIGNEDFE